MSGALLNIASAAVGLLFRPQRSLGIFVPHCVVEETHNDDMAITEHPVETGAPITDHAYKRPSEVRVRYQWSNADLRASLSITEDFAKRVYSELLILQASRQPFTMVTGKRTYSNMLMKSISETTTSKTEYMLDVTIICQEIIIVSTQTATLPPQAQHAQPQNTAPTQDTGVRQPVAVTNPNRSIADTAIGALTGR